MHRSQASSRPPFYSDATVAGDTGLLAATAVKDILPRDKDNLRVILEELTIINGSGKVAQITLHCADNAGDVSEAPLFPINLAVGETISGIRCNVAWIHEKNTDGTTQTGLGVRYIGIVRSR